MTTPNTSDRHSGRDRQASPTVAEIAAITRRLRELSARGRDVDAGERAGFLADKQALLDRITDRNAVDVSGYDSDAPLAAGERERAPAVQDAPWTAQGTTADTAHVVVTDDPHAENHVEVTRGRAERDADEASDGTAGSPAARTPRTAPTWTRSATSTTTRARWRIGGSGAWPTRIGER